MTVIIPDASVLLAPMLDETEYHNQITTLLQRVDSEEVRLCVPTICEYEVANTLSRSKHHNANDVRTAIETCEIRQLTKAVLVGALELMKQQKKISFYDASYHALAIESDGIFLTVDKHYVTMMKSAGNIQFIGDYA